jgi:hypothetical protein
MAMKAKLKVSANNKTYKIKVNNGRVREALYATVIALASDAHHSGALGDGTELVYDYDPTSDTIEGKKIELPAADLALGVAAMGGWLVGAIEVDE